jgi:hypothetical protein
MGGTDKNFSQDEPLHYLSAADSTAYLLRYPNCPIPTLWTATGSTFFYEKKNRTAPL